MSLVGVRFSDFDTTTDYSTKPTYICTKCGAWRWRTENKYFCSDCKNTEWKEGYGPPPPRTKKQRAYRDKHKK